MADDPAELYSTIDRLLDGGELDQAREALSTSGADDERLVLLRIKLGLRDGSIEPGLAQQRLLQLMRKNPDYPGAKSLYQEASQAAYKSRQSSVAHSHPPPPPSDDD